MERPKFLRDRAVITCDKEGVGLTFTHWLRRRYSWRLSWQDIQALEAMVVEVPCFELGFVLHTKERRYFISDDMENWSTAMSLVKENFHDFDWAAVKVAQKFENRNKPILCWKRAPSAPAAERNGIGQ
jgi:hypothetical protein